MKKKNFACEDLVLGKNVKIEKNVQIQGGKIVISDNTTICSGVKIIVEDYFEIGKNSFIRDNSIIRGRDIRLGREFYSNHHAEIGGGNCFEERSSLKIGYWHHQGSYSIINTARPVTIGNEVGLGRFTNIYTHGVYLSTLDGFPVTFASINIGDRVWMPSATINPGVTIGNDVVIGVGSLVIKNIPSGALAMGIPAKVIKENYFPIKLSIEEKEKRIEEIFKNWKIDFSKQSQLIYKCFNANFDFNKMNIEGKISKETERLRTIFRRNGIRFKVETDHEDYKPWVTEGMKVTK